MAKIDFEPEISNIDFQPEANNSSPVQPSYQPGFLQNLAGGMSNAYQGAMKGLGQLVGVSPQSLTSVLGGPAANNLMQLAQGNSNPNALSYKAGQMIGNVGVGAPLTTAAIGAAPEALGMMGRQALGSGLASAAMTPNEDNRLMSGIIGGGLGALPGTAAASKKVISGIRDFLNDAPVDKFAAQSLNNLTGGLQRDSLNSLNAQNIIDNYNNVKNSLSKGYQQLKSDAILRGYNPDYTPGLPGISMQGAGKGINTSSDTDDILNSISEKLSSNSQDLLDRFNMSPSMENAHKLQSALGSEASNIFKNVSSTAQDKEFANSILNARNNLLGDVSDSLMANGDQDLANRITDLSNQWRDKVVPYQRTSIYRAISGKGNFPSNIVNFLSQDDPSGNLDVIRNDLMSNPQQTKTLIGQNLLSKVKTNFDDNGTPMIDSSKLLDAYNNMGDFIRPLAESSPEVQSNINALQDKISSHATKKTYLKNALALGALTGAGTLGYKIKEFL